MPITAASIYNDVTFSLNKSEGGWTSADDFNNCSWLGQLALLDWLSGDISGIVPPEPYLTQKNNDWLSPFLVEYPIQVIAGKITIPTDYYMYESYRKLNGTLTTDCECDEDDNGKIFCDTPIELLTTSQYDARCKTWISDLKPSFEKPICTRIGNYLKHNPVDIGSTVLVYKRYPKRAEIAITQDPITHGELVTSLVDYEWDEYARGILSWFITRQISLHIREQALFLENNAMGKTIREAKT